MCFLVLGKDRRRSVALVASMGPSEWRFAFCNHLGARNRLVRLRHSCAPERAARRPPTAPHCSPLLRPEFAPPILGLVLLGPVDRELRQRLPFRCRGRFRELCARRSAGTRPYSAYVVGRQFANRRALCGAGEALRKDCSVLARSGLSRPACFTNSRPPQCAAPEASGPSHDHGRPSAIIFVVVVFAFAGEGEGKRPARPQARARARGRCCRRCPDWQAIPPRGSWRCQCLCCPARRDGAPASSRRSGCTSSR